MAHFDYTVPGGNWANVATFTAAHAASLDQKTYKSVNGDDGGVWAPSSFVEFGGAGVKISGTAVLETSAGGRIQLGNNDFPVLKTGHTGRSHTRNVALAPPISPSNAWGQDVTGLVPQSVGPGNGTGCVIGITDILHDGATLDQLKVRLTITSGHGALPANLPAFTIFQRAYGNGVQNNVVQKQMTAGNVALYENGGAEQEVAFSPATPHVIDKQLYYYNLAINDEFGANALAGNKYRVLQAQMGNIADMRFP